MADKNAFYPGYFPGDAQPRRPGGGGSSKPAEYNFDQLTNIIDAVPANFEHGMVGMPKWILDRAVDDWRQTLKVSIKPKGVDVKDLDDYDPSSLPGAFGIGINLDPNEWFRERRPGEKSEARKTLEKWWKAGVNWQDIETRYRKETWSKVFEENAIDNSTNGNEFNFPTEEIAVTTLGSNIGATVKREYSPTANPLALENRKIFDDDPTKRTYKTDTIVPTLDPSGNVIDISRASSEAKKIDVMKEFGDNVADFEIMGGFGVKREAKYDEVAFSGYRATVTEMEKKMADIIAIAPTTPAGSIERQIASNVDLQDAIEAGRARIAILDNMRGASSTINGPSSGVVNKMEKAILSGRNLNAADLVEFTRARAGIEKNLENIDNAITALAARPGAAKEAALLKKYTEPYKKQVEGLLQTPVMEIAARNVPGLTPPQVTALTEELAATNLRSSVNGIKSKIIGGAIGKPLKGGDPVTPSLERTLIRDSAMDIMYPAMRRGGKTIGKVVTTMEEVDNNLGSVVVRGGLNFTKNTSQSMTTLDLMEAFEQNKLTERYVWPRVRAYFESYTPAAYTEKFLKNNHYFGLDLGDSTDAAFEKSMNKGFGGKLLLGKNEVTGAAPGKIYGNYFGISGVTRVNTTTPTGVPTEIAVTISGEVYGGMHFNGITPGGKMQVVGKLSEMLDKNKLTAEEFKRLMEVKDADSLVKTFNWFNANGKVLTLPTGLDPRKFSDLDEFAKSVEQFKKWADSHKHLIESSANQDSGEYYAALVSVLNAQNKNADFAALGIYSRYVGLMQKLYYKFNSIQSAILSSRIGKALAFFAFGRKQMMDRIAALFAKTLTALLGSASGGLLASIAPVVERILRIVLNFVLDKVSEAVSVFAKAITQADINSVFKYIDKSVEQSAKVLLTLFGFFAMLFILPANAFVGGVATSFSPVDNTKITGIKDLFPEGMNLGSGVEIAPYFKNPSSVSCFEYDDSTQSLTLGDGSLIQFGPWPGDVKALMEDSLKSIQEVTGGYLARLCEKGTIGLFWSPPTTCIVPPGCTSSSCMPPGCVSWCGHILGGIGPSAAPDNIVFGGACTFRPEEKFKWYYAYLFAHETGHVYDTRLGGYDSAGTATYQDAVNRDGGTLDTYPIGQGACNTNNELGEDYPETIGDFVRPNSRNCPNVGYDPADPDAYCKFWQMPTHKNHFYYARNVMTRPYGSTEPTDFGCGN